MRKLLLMVAAICAMTAFFACTDENIGNSITDTASAIIKDSSFTMTGSSVLNNKVLSRTSTQLVGQVLSTGFGKITSDVVTELMPAAVIDTARTQVDWIDSCRLTLRIPNNGFTGDSLVPMQITAYELNQQLSAPMYSDFDPEGYFDKDEPLGSASYSIKTADDIYSLDVVGNTYATTTYHEIHIPLPVSYARDMFTLYKSHPEAFADPTEFKKYYPGLYLTTTFGSGRVMNFSVNELEVFYRQKATDQDTVETHQQSYAASSPEVISNNNITLEIDDAVKEMVANGDAIVMGPAGYEVNANFPIQEIIDKYKANTIDALAIINSLSLEIPVETVDNQYDIKPPTCLLMVKKNKKDEFFEGDSLTNSKNSFYAYYNSSKKTYNFTGMRDYIVDIISNKNGIATPEDINFVITPIDISTYTQQASAYSSASTVVTKIAPSVSFPSIAKLRLDKAKIKIVYSRQSNY